MRILRNFSDGALRSRVTLYSYSTTWYHSDVVLLQLVTQLTFALCDAGESFGHLEAVMMELPTKDIRGSGVEGLAKGVPAIVGLVTVGETV